jgi:hypothetical protein
MTHTVCGSVSDELKVQTSLHKQQTLIQNMSSFVRISLISRDSLFDTNRMSRRVSDATFIDVHRKVHEISSSHGGEYADGCLLGCCTASYGTRLPTFQRCFLPPSSRR